MDSGIIENYMKAGKAAADARRFAETVVKKGVRYFDAAEKIEDFIMKSGADIAFPVNISINDIAAHYTPTTDNQSVFGENDVVKVDVGVHIEGYIGDTAVTVCLDKEYEKMKAASDAALEAAVKLCKPGTKVSEISAVIEKIIRDMGYSPVSNLTGHGLERYDLHSDPQIPNISGSYNFKLKDGMAIAIEPFATNGAGTVKESEPVVIFSLAGPKPLRNPNARKIMNAIEGRNGLPFSERWIMKQTGLNQFSARMALLEMRKTGTLHDYPVLKEVAKGIVTQSEHTVLVGTDPVITTA